MDEVWLGQAHAPTLAPALRSGASAGVLGTGEPGSGVLRKDRPQQGVMNRIDQNAASWYDSAYRRSNRSLGRLLAIFLALQA